MYILVQKSKLKNIGEGRFYETTPDGRAIMPISELRSLGTIEGIDIIATGRELKELIESQKQCGLYHPEQNPTEQTAPDVQTDTKTQEGVASKETINIEKGGKV